MRATANTVLSLPKRPPRETNLGNPKPKQPIIIDRCGPLLNILSKSNGRCGPLLNVLTQPSGRCGPLFDSGRCGPLVKFS